MLGISLDNTIPMLFISALLPAHNANLHILQLRQSYLSGACSIAFRCVHPFAGEAAYCLSHRHPGSTTDNAHIVQLYRVCLTFIPHKYTLSSCSLSQARRFSGRDAVTEYKPYSPVPVITSLICHISPHLHCISGSI